MRRQSEEKLKCEDFWIKKSALLMFNYFTQSCKGAYAKTVMLSICETSHISYRTPTGDPSQTLRMTHPKCVALARQNARSDRVCLDFSLVTFFVAMTKT